MSTDQRRIPIVTKRMLAMFALLVLALLPFVAMAKDMPTLDEQLIDAAYVITWRWLKPFWTKALILMLRRRWLDALDVCSRFRTRTLSQNAYRKGR